MTPSWLRATDDGVLLVLHVQPGAKKTEIAGQHGEALKIRLAAPPVDGKANDCLGAFLAERLGVPKSHVIIEAGATSRAKRVRVVGVTAEAAAACLGLKVPNTQTHPAIEEARAIRKFRRGCKISR